MYKSFIVPAFLYLAPLISGVSAARAEAEATVLHEVIENIENNYFKTVNASRLFFKGVMGLRNRFDELKVFIRNSGRLVVLEMGKQVLEFPIEEIEDPSGLSRSLEKVLRLVSRGTTWGIELEYYLIEQVILGLDDPFTAFLTPEVYSRLVCAGEAGFADVGLSITMAGGRFFVGFVRKGSPAYKTGIRKGSRIIAVDGEPASNMSKTTLFSHLFGREGETVTLRLASPEGGERTVMLVKERAWSEQVEFEESDHHVAVMTIHTFGKGTASMAEPFFARLAAGRKNGLKGLVLDLRGNPGGFLEEGLAVVSHLLPKGLYLASVHGSDATRKAEYRSDSNRPKLLTLPMLVLVDSQSASVTELISLILKHYERALLIGSRTFGKGTVQSLFELSDGSALKLTVARYFGPDGKPLGSNVVPTIELNCRADTPGDQELELALKVLEKAGTPSVTKLARMTRRLLKGFGGCSLSRR